MNIRELQAILMYKYGYVKVILNLNYEELQALYRLNDIDAIEKLKQLQFQIEEKEKNNKEYTLYYSNY